MSKARERTQTARGTGFRGVRADFGAGPFPGRFSRAGFNDRTCVVACLSEQEPADQSLRRIFQVSVTLYDHQPVDRFASAWKQITLFSRVRIS